jgi:hypothetical protein
MAVLDTGAHETAVLEIRVIETGVLGAGGFEPGAPGQAPPRGQREDVR